MKKDKTVHAPIPVFHSYPNWGLSGVNSWTVNLAGGTDSEPFKHEVLFTGIPKQSYPELDDAGIDYSFLNLPQKRPRKSEWIALKHFLEHHAPCIYITNYDFHRSCAVGTLSPDVRVITIIHSDEACYFDELKRIGCNCDAIVCVSSYLRQAVKNRFPDLAERVSYIPYGIPQPASTLSERPQSGPIRLCYCNRLQQYQKRVFDLPLIAAELEKSGVDYELDIAGDGPDAGELKNRFADADLTCPVRFHGRLPNSDTIELMRQSHCFLLTSDFEGLPLSLLEAMSVGCVPIVYEIESGISDAIPSEDLGRVIPSGNHENFAQAVRRLCQDRTLLENLGLKAAGHCMERFSVQTMEASYNQLFHELLARKDPERLRRNGRICPPNDLRLMHRIFKRLSSCANSSKL